jgi:addiction module HigA family antidote
MVRIPTNREPTHPGEMLREEFLIPMNISQRELADAIHVPYQRVNELVNQKRGVTPSTSLRLAKFFGMSPDFWLNLQIRWDLYKAQAVEKSDIESIRDFQHMQNTGLTSAST